MKKIKIDRPFKFDVQILLYN